MSDDTQAAIGQQTLASLLAFDITSRRSRELQKKITRYPRSVSILSDIGECDRQMVYHITNWKDRPLHDEGLQALFDEGKEQERLINRDLIDLGYEIISQQEVVEIKNRKGKVIARGRIDGKIVYQKIKIPYEVKSMNPFIFESIDSVEDFKKKPYLRKYVRQMQAYLFGNNAEEGLLLCKNRSTGEWKPIIVTLDYGEAEQILQRLERVDEAITKGELPERIQYREEICGRCPFMQICLTDIVRTEAQVLSNEDLIERLERREGLKLSHSQYESLDKGIKDEIKKSGLKKGIAGEFVISVRIIETKEQVRPAGTQTRVEISRLKSTITE